jgi:CubicO group peptidase (beta-lactamase class C family)
MKKVILMFFLCGIISPSIAQKKIDIDSVKINRSIKKLKDSLNIPGIAVEIAIGNEIKYKNNFGYKDLETKAALHDSSIWQICSITKQFTTVACLKLVEEGKLSLQDKVSKYFKNLPESCRDITVCHLLSMTSGVKDYINEEKLYGSTWETVSEKVFSDVLNFKPGEAWSYSNTGFWIAAKIIENITRMDFDKYLEQNFLSKLQMNNTYRFSHEINTCCLVKGYEYRDNEYIPPYLDITKFQGVGDGELCSTLNDMLKWNIALVHGMVINKESISSMWTPSKLNNNEIVEVAPNSGMSYGMGCFMKNIEGKKIVWTPGSGFGFSSTLQYMPDYDLTIIVFCNKNQFLMADGIGFDLIANIVQ